MTYPSFRTASSSGCSDSDKSESKKLDCMSIYRMTLFLERLDSPKIPIFRIYQALHSQKLCHKIICHLSLTSHLNYKIETLTMT
uniref:Ovule protein n=1 Tax=Romanomermis culicivorax TaxID=13658 RepID=A0A915I892_ROMCU